MEKEEDVEQASLNFIPCLAWIRRGVAKLNPEKVRKSSCASVITNQRFTVLHNFRLSSQKKNSRR